MGVNKFTTITSDPMYREIRKFVAQKELDVR